jgi:hypothetical protein
MGNPFVIAEDAALKGLLQSITVADDKNANRPVKVWYGYPDVEVRDLSFPFITIDLIDIVQAEYRQTSGKIVDIDYAGQITPSENKAFRYDTPIAYDIVYQVTSYSRQPRHDRALISSLLNIFPSKYGYLTVPNQLGTESTQRTMILDGYVKRDAVDGETGNRRVLRIVFTVRVISEMPPQVAAAAITSVVQTVNVNTTTTSIPSGLLPLPLFEVTKN